ncbi:MAG: protein kinase [Gemmatimonadota bacterium]
MTPTVPDRLSAALGDRYRIERELGRGGMATVYLAEDLKHDRKVALKVLRPELAAVLGAERFITEIKTTAGLQHPHILPLFDSSEADGFLYYVMPYIEGETLRDRLNRETQLGIEEAVRITAEVADALDYAHRQGVIHRDIKPENILLHDGRPMVADFGIALAVSAAAGGRMTETGLSLGTPHYMSPEQATAERDLSPRSDIYSLASVLYEMLSGDPPHTGSAVQQIILKIVTEEATPLTRLRKSVPSNVAAAVTKALEKLPADRFESAAAFRDALLDGAFVGSKAFTLAAATDAGPWNRLARGLAAATAVFLIAVVALLLRGTPQADRPVSRFTVAFVGDRSAGGGNPFDPGIAIANDGSRFAFISTLGTQPQIVVRERDQLDVVPVRTTNDARCCLSFSPDGQSLAYLTTLLELKVVSLRAGVSSIVADSGLQDPSLFGGGVDWGQDGLLYLSMVDGVWRFSPDGGEPEQVTSLGPGERTHAWVDALPNGKGALLTIIPDETRDLGAYAVGVVDFATSEIRVLFQGVYALYSSSGHIVFVQDDGTMLAAPFDQDRLEATAAPVSLIENVDVVGFGAARVALSETGTLVYRGGRTVADRLVWVDRRGAAEVGVAPELDGVQQSPRLAVGGERLAVSRATPDGQHVWTKSLGSADAVRHTFEGQLNWRLNWSPDGGTVYFISDRVDAGSVFVKAVDGAALPRRLPIPESRAIFEVVPVDDETLLIRTDNQEPGKGDILLVHMGSDTTLTPLVATDAGELTPALSPDKRWMAYVSDASGSNEVYVRPFPDTDAGVFRVSTEGGTEPVWSHSGQELFYRNADGYMVAASVATEPSFRVTRQEALFSAVGYVANIFDPQFAVSPDDDRFLMLQHDEPDVASELVVVMNWFEELKAVSGGP